MARIRSSSPAGPVGPETSQRRTVSPPLPGGRLQSFAISAALSCRPMASPRSLRSFFNSAPVKGEVPSFWGSRGFESGRTGGLIARQQGAEYGGWELRIGRRRRDLLRHRREAGKSMHGLETLGLTVPGFKRIGIAALLAFVLVLCLQPAYFLAMTNLRCRCAGDRLS